MRSPITDAVVLDPIDYPPNDGEKWYIVHPNTGGAEFRIPPKAVTLCKKELKPAFRAETVYRVTGLNDDEFVGVLAQNVVYWMPQYLFARHFDAEVFVVGKPPTPEELERAKPYDYKPTLPAPLNSFYYGTFVDDSVTKVETHICRPDGTAGICAICGRTVLG